MNAYCETRNECLPGRPIDGSFSTRLCRSSVAVLNAIELQPNPKRKTRIANPRAQRAMRILNTDGADEQNRCTEQISSCRVRICFFRICTIGVISGLVGTL